MSDETTIISDQQEPAPTPEQVENDVTDNGESVEQVVDEAEAQEAQEPESDIVSEAHRLNEQLKAELEAMKAAAAESNIFEQNELLKKELEDAKRTAELANENKALQAQLEGIKRNALVDGMMADGRLNKDLKEWADGLTFEQLQTYAKKAPKVRNILEAKNKVAESEPVLEIREWQKQQNKSRIL